MAELLPSFMNDIISSAPEEQKVCQRITAFALFAISTDDMVLPALSGLKRPQAWRPSLLSNARAGLVVFIEKTFYLFVLCPGRLESVNLWTYGIDLERFSPSS